MEDISKGGQLGHLRGTKEGQPKPLGCLGGCKEGQAASSVKSALRGLLWLPLGVYNGAALGIALKQLPRLSKGHLEGPKFVLSLSTKLCPEPTVM